MGTHIIKKGLDLPIEGAPRQEIAAGPAVTRVAVVNDDYPLMKPKMLVSVGESVRRGQPLFEDRKAKGVVFTAPGAGEVVAIHRGAQRKLESVVIALSEQEQRGEVDPSDESAQVAFKRFSAQELAAASDEVVREQLSRSGLWTALRARPYGRVPSTDDACQAVFVTAMDSHPLAPSVDVIVEAQGQAGVEAWAMGLAVVSRLTQGPVFLCKGPGSKLGAAGVARVREEVFSGKHPAGVVGTHIHMLAPVSRTRTVWHLGAQDVLAIGKLFAQGALDVSRVISVAGPAVKEPRLVRARLGASCDELTAGQLKEGTQRVVSGSLLSGRAVAGEVIGYLGRYHQQLSCLSEGTERVLFGWLSPGAGMFSSVRAYLSALTPSKRFPMTTTTNGSHRAMVPIGNYERVMPLDLMPTFLLRALATGDLETIEKLGGMELDEEDLGLCSFVSPGKEDFGQMLRDALTKLWKEG
jgi:Na+-transporting NADH:ubiquinone oxidoreductase subunit A